MEQNDKVYIITHTSPELKTVRDFIMEMGSIAFAYASDIEAFGKVELWPGRTNAESIIRQHPPEMQELYKQKKVADMELLPGTKLAVEIDKVDRCALMTEGIEVVSNDAIQFKAAALARLESDKDYRTVGRLQGNGTVQGVGNTIQQFPNATVWIWCKALTDNKDEQKSGKIFDVTPYITSLTTSVTRTGGGSFQLSLAPVSCMMENSEWVLRMNERKTYLEPDVIGRTGFFSSGNMFRYKADGEGEEANDPVRSSFLFNSIISPNDVVFIRFETLQLEAGQREKDQYADIINKTSLPGRIYDMIGLVDKAGIQLNAARNEVNIEVTGRDLSKLFYDDGTYFFPFEFTQGKLGISGSASNSNPLMQRVVNGNGIYALGLYKNQAIDKLIKFIIQQLSTISIVPDSLFEAYNQQEDKLNYRYDPVPENIAHNEKIRNALAREKKAAIDIFREIRQGTQQAYPDAKDENAKLEEIFNEVHRFFVYIRKVKTRKADKNVPLTIGWKKTTYPSPAGGREEVPEDRLPNYIVTNVYNFHYEDPTMSTYKLKEWSVPMDRYINLEETRPVFKPEIEKKLARGIWQIVKLIVDKSVSNRRLIDSTLSSASGSLINIFRKVCQYPFVEFSMDTYGDMFYVTLRKPPFDRASILSALRGNVSTELDMAERPPDGKGKAPELSPRLVEIEEEACISESLEFSDAEAISWYQLLPKASLIGQKDQLATAYLPAVFFPEYAEQFGSRAMQLTHNYLPSAAFNPRTSGSISIIEEQTFLDLKHMMETTAYLPFTRSGTIVINRDRRIKAGNFIRYKPTGEIFFVEGVQHSLSVGENGVDASTTIQVSRGMVEQLIYGLSIEKDPEDKTERPGVYASYFNIIEAIPEEKFNELKQSKAPAPAPAPQPAAETKEQRASSGSKDRAAQLAPGNKVQGKPLDGYTDAQWEAFRELIEEINKLGYFVSITPRGGFRSFQQQVDLNKENSSNAQAGSSRHEFGTAIDLTLIQGATQIGKNTAEHIWRATGVPQLANRLQFQWGGKRNNGTFVNKDGSIYVDRVHFQMTPAKIATLGKSKPQQPDPPKEVTNTQQSAPAQKQVNLVDDVFKYFKVNISVFNFFLKRRQLSTNLRSARDMVTQQDVGLSGQGLSTVEIRGIYKPKKNKK